MNKKVSIIVPVYNAQDFLERCVNSILQQEYTNFELLLLDDGSTDRSAEICDRYAEADKRVRVIHKENSGVSGEGRYSFSLPNGWDIDNTNNKKDNIIATINNKKDIYGSISIVNSNMSTIYNNIKGNIISSKNIEDIYDWKFVAVSDEKIISNYYIRDYSEGKVLIIKFSYDEGKEKKSIKIVFDYIAMSFT